MWAAIKLPSPKPLKVQLPTGGSLQAFADISKGIPTDCAMTFSLLVQIAPFLAGTECLFKLLALIGPLIDVIKGLAGPDPIKLAKALPKFLKAAEKLAPCLLVVTGVVSLWHIFITAAVYDYSCRHPYDHHERMYRLAVVPGSAERELDGVVSFPARWSHQPSPPTDGRAEPVALRGS